MREGQQVSKGERLFWVTAEGPLNMRFTLPEKFIGRIEEVGATHDDSRSAGREVSGQGCGSQSRWSIPPSSTIEVAVELEGKSGPLRPGMDASVSLENLR